jgi:hypothetical protein
MGKASYFLRSVCEAFAIDYGRVRMTNQPSPS